MGCTAVADAKWCGCAVVCGCGGWYKRLLSGVPQQSRHAVRMLPGNEAQIYIKVNRLGLIQRPASHGQKWWSPYCSVAYLELCAHAMLHWICISIFWGKNGICCVQLALLGISHCCPSCCWTMYRSTRPAAAVRRGFAAGASCWQGPQASAALSRGVYAGV